VLALAVDAERLVGGPHGHAFDIFEEKPVANGMCAGRTQTLNIGDIAAYVVGNAAPAIGKLIFFFDNGDFGLWHQSLDAAGHFGAKGHSPNDQYIQFHRLSFSALKIFLSF